MADSIIMRFDKTIYSGEAIKRACSEMGDKYSCKISCADNDFVVVFDPLQVISTTESERELQAAVLSHQVRIDTENRFRTIRELIVAQAFAPCENLNEIVAKTGI